MEYFASSLIFSIIMTVLAVMLIVIHQKGRRLVFLRLLAVFLTLSMYAEVSLEYQVAYARGNTFCINLSVFFEYFFLVVACTVFGEYLATFIQQKPDVSKFSIFSTT